MRKLTHTPGTSERVRVTCVSGPSWRLSSPATSCTKGRSGSGATRSSGEATYTWIASVCESSSSSSKRFAASAVMSAQRVMFTTLAIC